MYQNNFFFILKKLFLILAHQNNLKISKKKFKQKKINFLKTFLKYKNKTEFSQGNENETPSWSL
jgi:hypothetical protein